MPGIQLVQELERVLDQGAGEQDGSDGAQAERAAQQNAKQDDGEIKDGAYRPGLPVVLVYQGESQGFVAAPAPARGGRPDRSGQSSSGVSNGLHGTHVVRERPVPFSWVCHLWYH